MLDSYAAFMAFYLSSTVFEHLQHTSDSVENDNDVIQTEAFSDCFADALNVVESLTQIADCKYALFYLPVCRTHVKPSWCAIADGENGL